ncbi:hypothetical protein [Streptomyces mutabilis]|uniref:Uncharacterized protein n=1 Tax=Streptomyces mutabilis TaxID=67332 RepID=A0A086MRA8_9ACTN|nr:hypothetical protein [Streptomyces mutabilis]KFG71426.1 hypothetical protein FM21_34675 [Streptomyces mutabilis]
MRALLREVAVPFRGARQTPRLLLLPLLTGSRLIVSFLLRRAARGIKRGWTAAMNLDAPPAAPAVREQGGALADDSASKPAAGTAKVSGKTTPAVADDAIERVGLGCLILLFAGVVIAGLTWLFMWLVWPHITAYVPVGGAVLTVAWVIAAWMIAPPPQETTTRNDHEKSAGEQEESEQDRFTRLLARFVVAAVRDAAPEHMGVHISELLRRLQQEARGFEGWEQLQLRKWCTAAGIPVSRNVRAKGKGPTWGVRADELQEAFGTSLDEALKTLARPAPRPPSEAPPIPAQAADEGPVTPVTSPPAEAPAPAPPSVPVKASASAPPSTSVEPHLQTVPAPSPDVVA